MTTDTTSRPTGWALLRAPFPADRLEYLPKQLSRDDRDRGKCAAGSRYCADNHPCGGYHARSIHLTYVGHAGVTDRLNEVDPTWTWEPMAYTPTGTPLWADGGLWIRLTVLGVTRIGFGDAAGKTGPLAVKEAIGDALRNAAMRFGVGTYLWSKSEAAQVLAAGGEPETPGAAFQGHGDESVPVKARKVDEDQRALGASLSWQAYHEPLQARMARMDARSRAALREMARDAGWRDDPRLWTQPQVEAAVAWIDGGEEEAATDQGDDGPFE